MVRVAGQTESEPVLAGTNGHFSMGATEVTSWRYSPGRLEAAIAWPWDHPLELVICHPGIDRWRVHGLGALPIPAAEDMIRIRLASRSEGTVVVEQDSAEGKS